MSLNNAFVDFRNTDATALVKLCSIHPRHYMDKIIPIMQHSMQCFSLQHQLVGYTGEKEFLCCSPIEASKSENHPGKLRKQKLDIRKSRRRNRRRLDSICSNCSTIPNVLISIHQTPAVALFCQTINPSVFISTTIRRCCIFHNLHSCPYLYYQQTQILQ